jgi:hypothetical protein
MSEKSKELSLQDVENNGRVPVEAFPELAHCLLHAAAFWKTDSEWSNTLDQINNVCMALLQERQQTAIAVKEALEGQREQREVLDYIKTVLTLILSDPCFRSIHATNLEAIIEEIDSLPQPTKTESK